MFILIFIHTLEQDAKEGERFYLEDIIDDIVAERFWGVKRFSFS